MEEKTLRELIDEARVAILAIGKFTKSLLQHEDFTEPPGVIPTHGGPDFAEMQANLMLAYRHLEDARMRLGKVIQAQEGGVSIYDKK
jgi:hypothetical protein